MDDLKERFTEADRMVGRDHWRDIANRAAIHDETSGRLEWPPTPRRRVVTAVVAFAVFAAAAVFAWDLSHPKDVPTPPPAVDTPPPVDLASELSTGWSELPAPPEVRSGAASVWTGSELFVWGGYVFGGSGDKPSSDDGFLFDAASRAWRPLPPSPLGARSLPASAWTGREVLVWGGTDLNTWPYEGFADGAAFNPSTGRWRTLPAAPIDGRAPMSVWTGDELIVWGTAVRVDDPPRDGAAYDPAADTWRTIAEAPIELTDATAVWTGEEMIVFGAALHGGNDADTKTAIGAAYDPVRDTWRELPLSELPPQASTAAWTGNEMVAWDYLNSTAAYDPATDTWRALPRVPIDEYECSPQSVSIPGQAVFGNYCGITPVFSVAKDRWRDVSRKDLTGWVLEPVAAGSAVLLMGHGFELSEVPDQEFEMRMLAWVPPSDPVEDEPSPFVPATHTLGDETRMPVVFPDGSRATLVYPTELGLAELGVQPDVAYSSLGRYQGHIVFLHDPDASIDAFVSPDRGSMLINASEGGLEVFPGRGSASFHWIRFELPSWTVLVPFEDPDGGATRTATEAVQVAATLDLRETSGGFPIVEVGDGAELAEGFGEAGGAQLALGDRSPAPDSVSQLETTIFLSPDGCATGTPASFSGGYGSACLANGRIFASIYGRPSFGDTVAQGLRVEDFVPA